MHNIKLRLSFLWKFLNRGSKFSKNVSILKNGNVRSISNIIQSEKENPSWIDASDSNTLSDLTDSFIVYNDFITEDEEKSLMNELEPYMRRLRYERDHWDDVSVHYFEVLFEN